MSAYSRPVLLLLCGLLLLTVSIAVLNTLVPLWLTHAQLSTWQVGMVSSSYFSGNLLGTLVAGKLIQRVGFTRSYHLSCLVFAAATSAWCCRSILELAGLAFLRRRRLRLDLGDRGERAVAQR